MDGTLILKGIENMNITSKEFYHQLAPDLKICRIVNGMWQVAGGHGYIDHELTIEDMMEQALLPGTWQTSICRGLNYLH